MPVHEIKTSPYACRPCRTRGERSGLALATLLTLSLMACSEDDEPTATDSADASGSDSAADGTSDAGAGDSAQGDGGQVGGCTRERLTELIEAYFKALAAHDPSSLRLAAKLKATENAQSLEPGQGLWKTAGALSFQRNVLDTERCATLTHGVIDSQGSPTIVAVRLQLEQDEISEIETYIVPATGFLVMPAGVSNDGDAQWSSVLPEAQRSSREALNAIAGGYFDLFGPSPGTVPFAAACQRFENGSVAPGVTHCSQGIPSGLSITGKRYPIADREAGIAVGFALFAGALDVHMFKVKSGKVVGIHALIAAPASSSGWD
jgi:hypothetical protein